jgi:hypothetical protein
MMGTTGGRQVNNEQLLDLMARCAFANENSEPKDMAESLRLIHLALAIHAGFGENRYVQRIEDALEKRQELRDARVFPHTYGEVGGIVNEHDEAVICERWADAWAECHHVESEDTPCMVSVGLRKPESVWRIEWHEKTPNRVAVSSGPYPSGVGFDMVDDLPAPLFVEIHGALRYLCEAYAASHSSTMWINIRTKEK